LFEIFGARMRRLESAVRDQETYKQTLHADIMDVNSSGGVAR
jgi:hypothetical protein